MHPSHTNYIASIAGELCNVTDDDPPPLLSQRTIVDLIEEAPGNLDGTETEPENRAPTLGNLGKNDAVAAPFHFLWDRAFTWGEPVPTALATREYAASAAP